MSLDIERSTFIDQCALDRKVLEAALDSREFLIDDDGSSYTVPVDRKKAKEIALEVFDNLVNSAILFSRASSALELVMKNHGLVLDKTFTMDEYMAALAEVSPYQVETVDESDIIPPQDTLIIRVVK